MNRISPRHGTRTAPEAAGLDADLRHEGGWAAISITDSPQNVDLILTNRTPHVVHTDMARVTLVLRPGILTDLDQLALAPQSEAQWALSLHHDVGEEGDLRLQFDSAHRGEIAPGGQIVLRLSGVSPSPEGGSRATRVELGYERFFHDDGPEIAGAHLLHLPVLRRHAPDHLPMRQVRGGSAAQAGPLIAGFVDGNGALNDGKSPNPLKVRLMNISGRNLRLSKDGDAASRLHIGWHRGRADGEWGLMSSFGDHLTLSLPSRLVADTDTNDAPTNHDSDRTRDRESDKGWAIDGLTLRCIDDTPLADGEYLELGIVLHTQAETGQAQLVISFENLPDHNDGDLVLLVDLGPMSSTGEAVDIVKPLRLYGEDARVSFHAAETFETEGQGSADDTPASIAINRSEANVGRLEIQGATGPKQGNADIALGAVSHPYIGFRENRLSAQSGDAPYDLHIQPGGKTTYIGGTLSVEASQDTPSARLSQGLSRVGYTTHILDNQISGMYRGNGIHQDAELFLQNNALQTTVGGAMTVKGRLHVSSVEEANLDKKGALIIGDLSGQNIAIDGNEIVARNNGAKSTLWLNYHEGTTDIGNQLNVRGDLTLKGELKGEQVIGRTSSQRGTAVQIERNRISGVYAGGAAKAATLKFQENKQEASFGGRVLVKGRLSVDSNAKTTDTASGFFVGYPSNDHVAISTNEITARSGRSKATLHLNYKSGTTKVGGELAIDTVGEWDGSDPYDVTWNPTTKKLAREGSSRRFKKNIKNLKEDFNAILDIQPRAYNMRKEFGNPGDPMFGYIAEELVDIGLSRLVTFDEQGRPDGVRYKKMSIWLTEVVKQQEVRIKALESRLDAMADTDKPAPKPRKRPT